MNKGNDSDDLFAILNSRKTQMMDDFVQYYIFLTRDDQNMTCSCHDDSDDSDDGDDMSAEMSVAYDQLLSDIQQFVHHKLTVELNDAYIWQREPFQLSKKLVSKTKKRRIGDGVEDSDNSCRNQQQQFEQCHLYGRTKFGENVDDEWFIVYLLFEISKHFPHCLINVSDNDGAFLLIESALFLPPWLEESGESDQHRIFIYRGALHWIPNCPFDPSHVTGGAWWLNSEYRSAFEAATVFNRLLPPKHGGKRHEKTESKQTMVNRKMQEAIMKRIRVYPEKVFRDLHRARVYLPQPIQYLLQENKQLVSHLVRSFVNRDSESMKCTMSMKRLLSIRDQSMMMNGHNDASSDGRGVQFSDTCSFCIVRMTKCLYAQLQSHRFSAPRILRNVFRSTQPSDVKAMDIGVKLTCAFEMLYWTNYEPVHTVDSDESSNVINESIINESSQLKLQWNHFKDELIRMGYFREEREGSALYRQLEAQAKQSFVCTLSTNMQEKGMGVNSAWIDFTLSGYSSKLVTDTSHMREDDDQWLDTGEGLDEFIDMKHQDTLIGNQSRHTEKHANNSDDDDNDDEDRAVEKATEIISGMKSFINSLSSVEGAEIPSNHDSSIGRHGKTREEEFEQKLQSLFSGLQLDDILDDMEQKELNGESDDLEGEHDVDDPDEYGEYMDAYMDAMDEQLSELCGTGRDQQFTSNEKDILQNLLESYKAQSGAAGPISNLMREMGIEMPEDSDELSDRSRPPSSKHSRNT